MKREPWVLALHEDLNDMFSHVRRSGVKVNSEVLSEIALEMVRDAPVGSPYHASTKHRRSGKLIASHVSNFWIRRFCERFDIATRNQTGKL